MEGSTGKEIRDMGQEVVPTDVFNYKIDLWRLEAILNEFTVARANGRRPDISLTQTIETLRWAVDTLQVPPGWEEQLDKAQQEAEFANEELRRLKMEMVEDGD